MKPEHQELAIACTETEAIELIRKAAIVSNERWQYGGQHLLETTEREYRFYRTDFQDQKEGYIRFYGWIAFLFKNGCLYSWDCRTDGNGITPDQNNQLVNEFETHIGGVCAESGLTLQKGKAQIR